MDFWAISKLEPRENEEFEFKTASSLYLCEQTTKDDFRNCAN